VAQANVFALGAIAYHVFAGRPPTNNALDLLPSMGQLVAVSRRITRCSPGDRGDRATELQVIEGCAGQSGAEPHARKTGR
jgi:hypothetical protein